MRNLIICVVAIVGLAASCARPYTYTSYEVVRTIDGLQPGDDVRIVTNDGVETYGQIVRVDDPNISIVSPAGAHQTVSWSSIRVLERVRRTSVTVD